MKRKMVHDSRFFVVQLATNKPFLKAKFNIEKKTVKPY